MSTQGKLMGSKNDQLRNKDDFYPTPDWVIDILLDNHTFDGDIWECACVDSDTEFFNGKKWIKISEYNSRDKVLQYNCYTGIASLTKPLKYHKIETNEPFMRFHNKYLDMALSKDHTIIYKNRRTERIEKDTALSVFEKYKRDSNGFRGRILTTFNYCGEYKVDDNLLRLAIACNADGREVGIKKKKYQIRVKKTRKKERLWNLLKKTNTSFRIYNNKDYLDVVFESPLGCKTFPIEWLRLSITQKKVFLEELLHWDGWIEKDGTKKYSTSKREDADFVQMMAHSIGIECSIHKDERGIKTNYILTFKSTNKHRLPKSHTSTFKAENLGEFKYCFTVPTSALVLRRNDKIFITGNCGNGAISEAMIERGYNVKSTDLVFRGYGKGRVDFLMENERYENIVTNPPFKLSYEFMEHCSELYTRSFALLLPIRYLTGKKRNNFYKQNPPSKIIIIPTKVDFIENGNPMIEFGWFIWEKDKNETKVIFI